MPRYSGVLASLFLIVLCVGFNIKRYPVVSEMLQNGGPRETANAHVRNPSGDVVSMMEQPTGTEKFQADSQFAPGISESKPHADVAETSYRSYASSSSSSSPSNFMGMARQPIPSYTLTGSTTGSGSTTAPTTDATVSDRMEEIRSGYRRSEISDSSAISRLSPDTLETLNTDAPNDAGLNSSNVLSNDKKTPDRKTSDRDGRESAASVAVDGTGASDLSTVDKMVRDAMLSDAMSSGERNTGENTTENTPMISIPQMMPPDVQKPGLFQTDQALPGYAGEYSGQSAMTTSAMAVQETAAITTSVSNYAIPQTPASAVAIASPSGISGDKENPLSAQEKFGIKKETPFVLQNGATPSKTSQRDGSEYVPPTMLPVTEDHETRGFLMPTAETGTVLTLIMPIPESAERKVQSAE